MPSKAQIQAGQCVRAAPGRPRPRARIAADDRVSYGKLPRMSSEVGGGTEGVLAAAGWYPDSSGVPRWWDGNAWDMARRSPGQESTWAMLSHLSMFVMLVVPALVLRVTVGRRDRFTRHHTTEALNAQIWFVMIWMVMLLPPFVTYWGGEDPFGRVFRGIALAFVSFSSMAGLAVWGAVQASRGSWWRYPVPFRVVSGSVRDSDRPVPSRDEHMTKPRGPLRALLWFSFGWGLFLVLLSFVMPIVTVWSGHDGPQPRISAFGAYGLVGILPAIGILAAVVLSARLLAFGRRAPSRTSLTLAEGVAGLLFIVGLFPPVDFLPVAFLGLGVFVLPLAASVLAAALTSEVLRQSREAG